jgi:hypothetical protein
VMLVCGKDRFGLEVGRPGMERSIGQGVLK